MTASIFTRLPGLFSIEIAKGALAGYTPTGFIGSNPAIGNSFETAWDVGGNFSYPTAGETWELLSDNANDTFLGIGARVVLISGLNDSFIETVEIVNLSGLTPVVTTTIDWFRIYNIIVVSSGSSEFNEGTITLRGSGGGLIRSQILPTMSRSFNGLFTVPLAKTVFLLSAQTFIPKGEDVIVRNRIKVFGTNTWLSGGDAPVYQNGASVDFNTLPTFPEKTDIESRVISTNESVKVTLNVEAIFINIANIAMVQGNF